mgnify:CR=1 FL=1
MVVLSDRDIKRALKEGKISIQPDVSEEQINPSSVDLRLGNQFRVFKHAEVTHIDQRNTSSADKIMKLIEIEPSTPFIIHPGEFVLGINHEYIKVPDDLVGRLDGKSSWGRLGIVIHSTAGTVDPGFEGRLTLEIANISKVPVCLYPGSRICKVTFDTLSSPSEVPYNMRKDAKYLKQMGPEASKMTKEEGKKIPL